ncbi:tetratricopeptide repeat protein [Streptomyces sp. NRRL F-5193]|uniref:tetratricopeptide repeat protein n=1 Tax=Streptomyces sp. NRRL F-5193 TaxID=1463860 RepID=UPI0006921290|nr:tetratricopeptide repeat protein [Streptomyces sp. NRRL F-5193]
MNTQARLLAEFLRLRIDESGKTLAVLSKQVGYSTSQLSTHLSGRIPPHDLVVGLIAATVPPALRERREAEAVRLLRDAEHPPRAVAKPVVPAQSSAVSLAKVQADQIQVYERLTRALEQEGELRQAAENSARLVWVLLGMVNTLEDRVRQLTGERDRLAADVAGGELEAARRRVGRAEEQKATAESELARAREKQRQAEELADRLRQEIEALTDDLDRLRGEGPSPHDHLRGPVVASPGPGEERDAAADDIDAALARATAVNDQDSDTIDRISTELTGQPTPVPQAQPLVPDNSLTSPDMANITAAQLKEDARAAAGRGNALEAARLYGALAARSAAYFGPHHQDTLLTRSYHAYWVDEAGDPATARDLYAILITAQNRAPAFADHEKTLINRHNHAYCTGKAGDPATARDLYADIVTDSLRVLGPDHKTTLASRHHHAHFTGEAGDLATARDLYAALITDRTRVLGPSHKDTLTSRHNHASCTGKAGDPATARDLYAALMADQNRVLGPDHENTLTSRHNHASCTGNAGDPATARDLYAHLITDRTRVLGPDHEDTLASRKQFDHWAREASGA